MWAFLLQLNPDYYKRQMDQNLTQGLFRGTMTSSPIKIKLLGPVEITYEDQPLKIGRRMERAILYYLAAENRPISRKELIDLLWRDEEEVDQRGALRTTLSRLRRELPVEGVLQTELDQVWLDENGCWSDLTDFNSSFTSLRFVLRNYQKSLTFPGQIVEQIEQALGLWRGKELLQGENLSAYPEIENWRRSLQRELSHQRGTLMEKLANHYRASGRLERALSLFVQLGKMDLFDVMVHLAVLDVLTRMRRFQEAVDYCDELEIDFEREYNAPLPEPILKQYQYSKIQLQASQESQAAEWPVTLSMQLPLVGRDKELTQLEQAYYRGGIVVIQGELGCGKTRLVQDFFQSSRPSPNLFYTPSQEKGSSMPLSPIIHGLRQHVTRKVWESIDRVWAERMSLLLPEIAEYREDCTASQFTGAPIAKQQLFDAVLHVLQTLVSGNQKLLFFLDDAQWVDNLTLEAVAYLVMHGFFEQNGLLIVASRSEEPNQELGEMIDQLHRTQNVQTIKLNGLSPQDLSALITQALEEPPSPALLDQLYRETNGNPFFALEIIRYLLENPGEFDKPFYGSSLPLPENLHAIIRKRLNSLDDRARRILVCSAVIGNQFSLELLSAVIEPELTFELKLLDPLIKFGFLQPDRHKQGAKTRLQFTHEIMRKVALKEASPIQRSQIHHRIADFLADRSQDNSQAALIANHYQDCGENRQAFHWYIKAAAHAWSFGAKEETNLIFLTAESLYKNGPQEHFSIEDLFVLYRQWGQFAYEADQIDLLEEVGFKLQYLGEQEHDPLLLGVANMLLANACFLRMKMSTGQELIRKAVNFLQHTGDKQVMIEAKLRQAAFSWWNLDFDATIQFCQDVLRIGETPKVNPRNLNEYLFFARHSISYAYYAKGNAKKTLSYASETYDRYFHQLSAFNRMRTYNMLANANLIAANYGKSQSFAKRGLEIAQTLENAFVTQILLTTQSKAETIQGRLDEAYKHASQALALGEENSHNHTIISANCTIGDIYFSLQEYTLALQHYRVAQLRAGYSKESYYSLDNELHLARALAWMGQLTEARELAARAVDKTKEYGMLQLLTVALRAIGLCDMLEGRLPEAKGNYLESERLAVENGLVYELLWTRVGRARLALSERQFSQAKDLIREILKVSKARNFAWAKLNSLQLCAHLHNATSDTELLEYRSDFREVVEQLAGHVQSTPLKQYLETARQFWEKGHAYP
jgi:DNA-binding SARP family transcriptional activator